MQTKPQENPESVTSLQPRKRLATVAQAAALYPVFSQLALRDLIFKAADRFNSRGDRIAGNGLAEAGAIVRIGRKVLIDLDAFEAWIDSRASSY